MKKTGLILIVCLYTALALTGCAGSSKKTDTKVTEEVKVQYQCPMKCTEEKFDKPGKCPVCGMELEKVTTS